MSANSRRSNASELHTRVARVEKGIADSDTKLARCEVQVVDMNATLDRLNAQIAAMIPKIFRLNKLSKPSTVGRDHVKKDVDAKLEKMQSITRVLRLLKTWPVSNETRA